MGIVSVVDFSGDVRPREEPATRRLYEGWGRITDLPRPVSVAQARDHPLLGRRFGSAIQSVQSLTVAEAQAISDCAGGLPESASFVGYEAQSKEPGGDWSGIRLPPEEITEKIVCDKDRVARKLGFPTPVNPGRRKRRLANGRYPDLWCEAGVVGEVKNQVAARWGPEQIEGYIDQCDIEWPAIRWRGILVQGEPEMARDAAARLESSRHADRIEVWTVYKRRLRTVEVRRLFPPRSPGDR